MWRKIWQSPRGDRLLCLKASLPWKERSTLEAVLAVELVELQFRVGAADRLLIGFELRISIA